MSAWRRRDGNWYASFTVVDEAGNPRRFRRALGPRVRSAREADAAERELLVEQTQASTATDAPQVVMPQAAMPASSTGLPAAAFSGFALEWLKRHVKVNCKPSQIRKYESVLRTRLVPHFGDVQLMTITSYDVEWFRSSLVDGGRLDKGRPCAPKTINNVMSALSSLMDAALRWGYVQANPCRQVRLLRVPPNEMRFWDGRQTEAFLSKAKSMEPQWHAFFLTGFRTGARLGELFGLRWADVDFVKRRLCVQRSMYRDEVVAPKNNKARWIPMTADLEATLKAYRHMKGDLIFSRPDGRPLTRDIVKHPFSRITYAAGLPAIRVHDLRHSFASQLAMAGVSLLAISKLLGHSGTQVTERYAHLSPSSLDDAVKVLEGKTPVGLPDAAAGKGGEG